MPKKSSYRELPDYIQNFKHAYDILVYALDNGTASPMDTVEGQSSKAFIGYVQAIRELIKHKMEDTSYRVSYQNNKTAIRTSMNDLVWSLRKNGEYQFDIISYQLPQKNEMLVYIADDILDLLVEKIVMLEVSSNYFIEKRDAKYAYNSICHCVQNHVIDLVKKMDRENRKKVILESEQDEAEEIFNSIFAKYADARQHIEKSIFLNDSLAIAKESIIHEVVHYLTSIKSFNILICYLNTICDGSNKDLFYSLKNEGYKKALVDICIKLSTLGIDVWYLLDTLEYEDLSPNNDLKLERVSRWTSRSSEMVRGFISRKGIDARSFLEAIDFDVEQYIDHRKRAANKKM